MYSIYALIDPRDRLVYYVGMTDNVYVRFQQHIKLQGNNDEKIAWLKTLREADVMVFMKTLETIDDPDIALQREAYWIQHYRQLNMPLTNRYVPVSLEKMPRTEHRTKVVVPSSNKAKSVLRALKRNPDLTPTELSKKLGVSRSYASEIKTKLN